CAGRCGPAPPTPTSPSCGPKRCTARPPGTASTIRHSCNRPGRCRRSGAERAMVVVRYFAGARAAAGVAEEKVEAATLAELVASLALARGAPLARVLASASFLVDGLAGRDHASTLPEGATVDVLPPFAGG